MDEENQSTRKKDVRNLIIVIFSGVLGAFALTAVMLYNYNPTGRYIAKNVLLSPLITSQIYFTDTNPKTGTEAKYIFEGVEFSYFDAAKQWRHQPVTPEAYQQFYKLVSEERSLPHVSPEVEALFNQSHPASLALKVHADNANALIASSKTFLEVVFAADSDYYRVQLQQAGPTGNWAYYFHPQIYREAMLLFVKKP